MRLNAPESQNAKKATTKATMTATTTTETARRVVEIHPFDAKTSENEKMQKNQKWNSVRKKNAREKRERNE